MAGLKVRKSQRQSFLAPILSKTQQTIASAQGSTGLGILSFLTGQNRTPKFAGQVLQDRTESGLIFLNILPTKYRLSILIR